MHIEIFGKDNCPFCDLAVNKAQQSIQETEHTYEYQKLEKDFTREELFEQFPTARTFPQIRIDGEAIGGWTEFAKVEIK
jgi:glutaredoxin 3